MDWIFDHLQLLIIIGSSIAWWLTQQRKEKEDEPPQTRDRPGRPRIDWQHEEQDESDAARRVRERMRQLREQRGQSGEADPASAPSSRPELSGENLPPVLRELFGIPEPQPRPAPVSEPPPVPIMRNEAADRIAEQMRELEARQREAEALAARVSGGIPGSIGGPRRRKSRPVARTHDLLGQVDFLKTLRDPKSARRAILLKEVLDRPVGLR